MWYQGQLVGLVSYPSAQMQSVYLQHKQTKPVAFEYKAVLENRYFVIKY